MSAKEGFIAASLSVIAPGSGHLYLGSAPRFFIAFVVFIALILCLGFFGLISTLSGFAICFGTAIALLLFGVFDSFTTGLRMGRIANPWYSRWHVIILWMVALLVLTQLWASTRESLLGYSTFRVPSMSMAPALFPGDIVLVDTRAHNFRDPRINTMVVVRHPQNRALYIRRVKEKPSSDTVSVLSDSPLSPDADKIFQAIPRAVITGVVTTILWSPSRQIIAQTVQ